MNWRLVEEPINAINETGDPFGEGEGKCGWLDMKTDKKYANKEIAGIKDGRNQQMIDV